MEITPSQTCDDFFLLLQHIRVALMDLAEKYELTTAQIWVLYAILNGHTKTGDVAYVLQCDASNITGMIDRLITQKLVTRKESKEDRRTKTLALTLKGKRTIHKIVVKLPIVIGCQDLTGAERQTIHRAIAKLGTVQ